MKFSEIINDQQLATEAIRRWITTAVCIVVALITANWIVNGQFFMLALFAGVVIAVAVTVGMQRNAWILVVVSWAFKGQIHALSVPLAIRDLVIMVVACSYVAQRAILGQSPVRGAKGVLGALVAINFGYFFLTFLRHPVGLHSLGSGTVGGRPYFNILIAWAAYWIIVHMPESYKSVTRIPLWLLASTAFAGAISVAVYLFPPITPFVWFFYSDIDISEYVGSLHITGDEPEIHRFFSLAPFGLALIQVLVSYCQPRTILNPLRLRFYLVLLGFVAILASGFRSSLLVAFASLALGSWFHRGWRGVAIGGVVGALLLGFVLVGQGRWFSLPLPAQRALGSLPGQWDEAAVSEVKTSNLRWEWWRRIIEGGVIKNWWTGDGFAITEEDYNLITGGTMGFEEAGDIVGGFHNGPLTAIRAVGIVGLALYYALMFGAAAYSVKCVRRCRGTPLLPLAIFLAIQFVWTPIQFTFVFGSYDNQLADYLFMIGLLTLVGRMSERPPPSTEPVPAMQPLSRYNGRTLVST